MHAAARSMCATAVAFALAGCGTGTTTTAPTTGNGSVGTTTNVAVTVTPATSQIDVGQTVALTATVTGDSSNRGVTWTVTGGGTVTSTTGLTNTYTAPASAAGALVTASSVLDATKSASAAVTVNPAPALLNNIPLASGYAGVAYTTTVGTTGGTGSKIVGLASGSSLPAGLVLNGASGTISGTPAAAGTTTFVATVTDSATPALTTSASFTLGVSAMVLNAPALTTTVVGRAYAASTYAASGSVGAVTYAVSSGSLPAGLTLSSAGVLSGTTTTSGTSTFTVTATDSIGQRASAAKTIAVASVLTYTAGTLAPATGSSAYSASVATAANGMGPYTYGVASGSVLPSGLGLSAAGVLSGVPTAPGTYTFSLSATDAGAGQALQVATAQFTLVVKIGPLRIVTTTLPNGVIGSPYSQSIVVSGGLAPFRYTVTTGSLPAGTIVNSYGMVLGKPTTAGTSTFMVQVADAEQTPMTATQQFTIAVTATLPPGPKNAALSGSYAFVATGQTNGASAAGATTSGQMFGSDAVGSLTFDGVGSVTGTVDFNSSQNGYAGEVAVSGSYTVGNDNRGQFVLQVGSNTTTADIAISAITGGVAGRFRLVQADGINSNDLTQTQGSGVAMLQVPADFTMGALAGRYVYALNGETPCSTCTLNFGSFGAISAAGYISLSGGGLVTAGSQDAMVVSATYPQVSQSGSYTAPSAAGRGTLILNPLGPTYPNAARTFVYYIVSARQIVLMSIENHGGSSLLAGMAYQQQQAIFSTAQLAGTVIAAENGVQGGDGNTTQPTTRSATIEVLKITANGAANVYQDSNVAGTTSTNIATPTAVTYAVSTVGRVTFGASGLNLPVFWLYDNNNGVGTELHTGAGPIGTLSLEPQTAAAISGATLSGLYGVGTAASVSPVVFTSGSLSVNGSVATLTTDSAGNGAVTNGVTTVTNASVNSAGQLNLTADGVALYGYVLSAAKVLYFNAVPGFASPVIFIGEQ